MTKFWWKDEPLIVGSLRYQIVDNDLKNTIKEAFIEFKQETTINDAVKIAHGKGLRASFKLIPNR